MKEILITSSVLILAVMLLRLVFRGKVSQKLIYGAWLLVALRLLVPVQFGSFDFSILNQVEPVTELITEVSKNPVAGPSREEVYQQVVQDYIDRGEHIFIPEVEEKLEAEEVPSYEQIFQEYPIQSVVIPEINTQIQQEVEKSITAPTVGQIAAAIWIAGMAVMALWFVFVNLRFHRALEQTAQAMEVPDSPVPVMVDATLPSPCLFGFFRPKVYLTPVCTKDETHLRHVLTHELTHYAHKDHIWSLVRCVCLCVYWFNPLVWIAAGLAKRDCELACDEAVLKRLGDEERISYGKTLVDMVANSNSPAHYLETATAMYETKKALKERVNHIMKKHKHLFISALSLILVLFIATGCVFTGANLPTEPHPTDPPTTTDPPETTVPPTTSPVPTRKELDALTYTIGDAVVALGKTTEADYEDPAEYQRVRSFISNISGWEAVHDQKVVRINFKILNDTSVSVFRKYILDSEFIRFQDYMNNCFPRTDPQYENSPYDTVSNPSEGLELTLSTDGTYYLVTGIGTCTDTEIIIPSEKDGLPVRAIRYWAFVDQTDITTVTVPNSVLCIESAAFYRCTELINVKLPDTLQSIGDYAFSNCEKLSDITLPASATNLGESLFYGCIGLTSMALPNGIETVSAGMFYGCTGLVSVTIPDSVTKIGSTAFYECTSLTEIRIPANVRSIGRLVFGGCVDLTVSYADTVQRWNSIIKEDSLSRPVHCTDGDAANISSLDYLLSTVSATGLSYPEWLYRYYSTVNAHLGESHEDTCAIENISQYADKNGDLIIRHQCGDRSEAYVEIPWDPHAGTLSEESEIYGWLFSNSTSGADGEAWRYHLSPAFAADPETFVKYLSAENEVHIEFIAQYACPSTADEKTRFIAQCESIRDASTDEAIKETVQTMLDVLT